MGKRNKEKENIKREEEFEQKIVDLARVTRVTKGGKRMKFRACLAIGDKKGRVGFGIAKGADVTAAVTKAFNKAKKKLITVPLINETIPHPVVIKYKSAKILFKPAKKGTGVKAGGAVRIICELAGIANVTSKILGSNNKINNVRGSIMALSSFKSGKKTTASEASIEKIAVKEEKVSPKEQGAPANKIEEKKTFKDKIKSLLKNKSDNN